MSSSASLKPSFFLASGFSANTDSLPMRIHTASLLFTVIVMATIHVSGSRQPLGFTYAEYIPVSDLGTTSSSPGSEHFLTASPPISMSESSKENQICVSHQVVPSGPNPLHNWLNSLPLSLIGQWWIGIELRDTFGSLTEQGKEESFLRSMHYVG